MCCDTEINSVEDYISSVRNGTMKVILVDENGGIKYPWD